jgi:hypothetical protein
VKGPPVRPVNSTENTKDQISWMTLMTRAKDVSPNVEGAAPRDLTLK